MSQAIKIVTGVLAITAAWLWGNYRWHQGFTAGADAILCVEAHQLLGPEAAMREPSCQAISGRTVPYFPERLRPQGPPAQVQP